ncbi:hypothetical protein, partial [Pseudomonas sp. GL-B-26]|uniref:hypothetical protein n=1 Tax=Pseudomonas sp. GL-B-26 TaxID=2832394 RepID=UPI001CBFD963
GLLAKAVGQSRQCWMCRRLREQARSHIDRTQLLSWRAVKAFNHANKIKRVNRHAHEPEG